MELIVGAIVIILLIADFRLSKITKELRKLNKTMEDR